MNGYEAMKDRTRLWSPRSAEFTTSIIKFTLIYQFTIWVNSQGILCWIIGPITSETWDFVTVSLLPRLFSLLGVQCDWSASFFLRVKASFTILSLISAYYYYFVTEKTGRGIEITTRLVTYLHGSIYFRQLQGACYRQRTCKGRVSNQAKKNARFLWYLCGILIGKCVQCTIITAVTLYNQPGLLQSHAGRVHCLRYVKTESGS